MMKLEMCCAADNHNDLCHICAKEFLDSNFNQAVIDQVSFFFTKLPQISHIYKNSNCSSIIGTL